MPVVALAETGALSDQGWSDECRSLVARGRDFAALFGQRAERQRDRLLLPLTNDAKCDRRTGWQLGNSSHELAVVFDRRPRRAFRQPNERKLLLRIDLQQREVACRIGADELGGMVFLVVSCDLDRF